MLGNTVECKKLIPLDLLRHEVWEQKTKFFKEFSTNMLMELKRDYINEHGVEKYLIEEETIKKEMNEMIFKQQKMLLEWNESNWDEWNE